MVTPRKPTARRKVRKTRKKNGLVEPVKEAVLSNRFRVRFLEDDLDGRSHITRELKRRYAILKEHLGIESAQGDLLVRRLTFISAQLESMEVDAAAGAKFDPGVYTQMTNAAVGLIRLLGGIERKQANTLDLKTYLASKAKPNGSKAKVRS